MNYPVFDLHCDTAYTLLGQDFQSRVSLWDNQGHIDLKRAALLPAYVQCFACFTSPVDSQLSGNISTEQLFALEYEHLSRELEIHSDYIRLAKNGAQIRANADQGYMSAILTIEGTAGFQYDPDMLDDLYAKGFRISTLGWNERNCLTGSHATGGGLTQRGREYVQKAQSLGILVDVSHISDEAFWDIMEITEKPILATHSNSRSVHSVSRNLTDEMFRAICKTEGLVGINLYTVFLGYNATLDTVCDHILHFLELDQCGSHIALGSDMDGCDHLPQGFCGIQSYPALADRLLARGVQEDTVYNIFWNNALGVFERCCT